jgi:hypothetical protein
MPPSRSALGGDGKPGLNASLLWRREPLREEGEDDVREPVGDAVHMVAVTGLEFVRHARAFAGDDLIALW